MRTTYRTMIILGLGCVTCAAVLWMVSASTLVVAQEPSGAQKTEGEKPDRAAGQAIADTHMDQWKRKNPDRAADWVAEEKERHAILPPADNSDLLKGKQGEGHTYGQYTERDILMWARETEKLVAEGSRIFHDADLLGSTVAVSCDMCHPDGSNTHPETYPKFQTQMGRVALLRDMINWCIERPVRGERFEPDDPRMRALEAYIYAQRKGTPLNYGKH
jgi:thiosulfate dehydrogenase